MNRDHKLEILVLCGSLRRESFNKMLVRTLPELSPDRMSFRNAPSFEKFPIYNADVQNSAGFPKDVKQLADALRSANGVLIVTPEYNFSIPGGLKNALDWLSRLEHQPFSGKPVAIQSASVGPVGGARAQYHLRQAMVFLDAFVLNTPEVFVADVASRVNEEKGKLTDELSCQFIRQQLDAFARFIDRVSEHTFEEPQRKSA